jgi:hypothetical protein
VAVVGLGGWISELETRNNAFGELVKSRFDETAARTDIVLKEARAELDAAYFAIRERLNALAIVEGAANYETFIKTLNAVIAKYAVRHHHRHRDKQPRDVMAENFQPQPTTEDQQ